MRALPASPALCHRAPLIFGLLKWLLEVKTKIKHIAEVILKSIEFKAVYLLDV